MTRSMARRLSRYTARFLASILFLLAPGLDAHRAAAQVVTGRVSSVPTAPLTGLPQVSPTGVMFSGTPSLALPSAAAPLALSAPVVPGANAVVSAAGAAPIEIAAAVKVAAPALQAVASAKSGAGDVSSAGHELIGALTGEQVAARSAAASAIAGAYGADRNALSAASEAPAPQGGDKVPAATTPKVKKVESAFSYKIQRSILKMVAAATGAVFSLPQAGPALTKKVIARAADKQAVISDYDDTLSEFSKELSGEMIEAIRAVRAAGKQFVVISDRSDEKRPGSTQQTVFESLSVLPADLRAGMYVAANSGGRVYKYDEKGEPVKVYEAPVLDEAQKATLKEVSDAVKARLSEVGAEQHPGDAKNPAESHNPYGYALMLKVGSSEKMVLDAADIMSEELAKRGWLVDVKPRFAKDPKNPPYISMSVVTKATPSAWIAKALGLTADQIVITGDSMYAPKRAKSEGRLTRLGRKISGSDIPAMGNETDRNMERGLPGALALGVGLTADPTMADGWALDGKGPEVTLAVLKAVASKPGTSGPNGPASGAETTPAAPTTPSSPFAPRMLLSNPTETYGQAHKTAVEIAAKNGIAASEVKFVKATANMPVAADGKHWHYTFTAKTPKGETALIYVDFDRFFGGQQDFRGSVVTGNFFVPNVPEIGMVRALEPLYFANLGRPMMSPDAALELLRAKAPYFGARVSLELYLREEKATGEQDLWYRFYDEKGSVGAANLRTGEIREMIRPGLSYAIEPNELYALALEKISETAAKSGLGADKIRLISAVHEERRFNGAWVGDEWRFHFSVNGLQYTVPTRRTMITETMMDAFEPKLSEARVSSLIEGIPAADFGAAVTVTPKVALALSDREVKRLSLVERGGDLWYSVQDERGSEIISVNARTGATLPGDLRDDGASWRSFLIGVALFGVVAAIYYAMYWAMTNAPAAQVPNPGGWQGPVPSIEEIFGALGAGAMLGGLRKAKKDEPKVTDAEIESAAKGVAASKGGVWSQTEYNMAYYNTLENLAKKGATKAQLERFKKLCDEAPVLGRGFNPWSGD